LRIGLAVAGSGLEAGPDEFTPADKPPVPGHDRESNLRRMRRIGDYELLEEIAHGGMGLVYKARQASLGRVVALKLIRAGELANESEVARFRAEAEAAAHLDHPNIVPIYEVGEHEGCHYFSMKLVEGGALSERISKRQPRISDRETAKLLAVVARAVHYAHQRGILHRDLKPGNILIDRHGQPHVTDFGLAKRIDTDSAMTQSGTIVGTPGYLAPEQAAGARQLTTAADIYSLGAILYELLAGRPPFVGATVMETLQKVMNEDPVPPSRRSRRKEALTESGKVDPSLLTSAATGIDRDLETICLKCLEKEPARRYGSAEALADDLERWLRHEPIRGRPVTLVERLKKWARRNPLLAGSLAALLGVTVLSFAGITWQWRAAITARNTAQQAGEERREQLWQSLGQQAHFSRHSGAIGQRTNALAAIALAAAIRPSLDLRDDALGALLLPDLGARLSWKPGQSGVYPWCFDAALEHYVLHDDSGLVAVYRAADHSLVRELGRGGGITAYAQFSPDDRLVAVAFEGGRKPGELRVWDWHTGQLVAQITNAYAKFGIPSFDFTSDGLALLYAAHRAGLGRLNLTDGQSLPPTLTNVATAIVRVSPDGAYVSTGKGRLVEVWEITSGRRRAGADFTTFPGAEFIHTLAWAPNGGGLAVSVYGTGLYLLRLDDSPPEHFGDAKDIAITSLFFNATGDLLFAGGWNDLFQIWDVATLTPLIHESHHHGSPRALSRDGRRLALTRETIGMGVWEFHEPTGLRKFIPPLEVNPWPASLDVHPKGRWLLTTHLSGWLLWDTSSARVVARGPAGPGTVARFTPDGTAFHTCGPDGLKRWPLRESEISDLKSPISVGSAELITPGISALPPPDKKNSAAAPVLPLLNLLEGRYAGAVFSADGRHVALQANGYLVRINLATHGFARPVQMRRPHDNDIGISADGRWLWTGHHNQAGLDFYDLEEGKFAKELVEPGQRDGLFHPGTGEFVASNTRGLTFWQTGVWKPNRGVPLADLGLGRSLAAIAPDGRAAWFTWSPQMRLLDTATGKFFATFEHPATLHSGHFAFDPTAPRAYADNGNGIIAWDLAALRRELARLGLDWRDDNPSGSFLPRQP
jgi:WD40 repeat protein/tRNA A-37 threonylcarbamoyl transferase component Bud32